MTLHWAIETHYPHPLEIAAGQAGVQQRKLSFLNLRAGKNSPCWFLACHKPVKCIQFYLGKCSNLKGWNEPRGKGT